MAASARAARSRVYDLILESHRAESLLDAQRPYVTHMTEDQCRNALALYATRLAVRVDV